MEYLTLLENSVLTCSKQLKLKIIAYVSEQVTAVYGPHVTKYLEIQLQSSAVVGWMHVFTHKVETVSHGLVMCVTQASSIT